MTPRLALTTTRDRAGALAELVARESMVPVVLPCVAIQPVGDDHLEDARDSARRADLVVITSARTVTSLWPNGGMPSTPVAAVGEVTARAVAAAGGQVIETGGAGVDDIIRAIGPITPGRMVFFPHGSRTDRRRVAIPLEDAGASVTARVVYTTHPISPDPEPVDGAIFGSPSAVDGWAGARPLEGLVVGVIGRTTAQTVLDRGLAPDVVADRPDYAELIRATARRLREGVPI